MVTSFWANLIMMSSVVEEHDWGKPERAPHWQIAHTRFVVDSVQEKYKQIQQTTLQVYHNMVSMRYIINHDMERIFMLSTITRKYAICAWCYQPWHGKHFGAINRNMESMQYVLGAINHDTEKILVLSTVMRKVCDTCLAMTHTESILVLSTITQKVCDTCLVLSTMHFWCYQPLHRKYAIHAWCYQPWHGKHSGAINHNKAWY